MPSSAPAAARRRCFSTSHPVLAALLRLPRGDEHELDETHSEALCHQRHHLRARGRGASAWHVAEMARCQRGSDRSSYACPTPSSSHAAVSQGRKGVGEEKTGWAAGLLASRVRCASRRGCGCTLPTAASQRRRPPHAHPGSKAGTAHAGAPRGAQTGKCVLWLTRATHSGPRPAQNSAAAPHQRPLDGGPPGLEQPGDALGSEGALNHLAPEGRHLFGPVGSLDVCAVRASAVGLRVVLRRVRACVCAQVGRWIGCSTCRLAGLQSALCRHSRIQPSMQRSPAQPRPPAAEQRTGAARPARRVATPGQAQQRTHQSSPAP